MFRTCRMRSFWAVWVGIRHPDSGVSVHMICLKKPALLIIFLDEMKPETNLSSRSQY